MSFMASAQSALPNIAVGEWTTVGFGVQSAFGSMALLAMVCFAIFSMGLQRPKGLLEKDCGTQAAQKAPAKQKNKNGKAKKNKKARNAVPSKGHRKISEVGLDEEARNAAENAMSDVEAPSMTKTYDGAEENHASDIEAQSTADLCNASDDDVGEQLDTVLIVSDFCESDANKTSSAEAPCAVEECGNISEDCAADSLMEDSVRVSVMKGDPEDHYWGCPTTRTYTSSLLLMHYEVHRAIARGPPGLEPPAQSPATAQCRLKVMKM